MARLFVSLSLLLALLCPLSAMAADVPAGQSQLQSIATPWRVTAGDDPAFAQSGFDDSRWAVLKLDEPFAHRLALPPRGGVLWARLHLQNTPDNQPAGLGIGYTAAFPFTVYVNGVAVSAQPADSAGRLRRVPPFTLPLPPSRDITVALRIRYPPSIRPARLPVNQVTLGTLAQVQLTQRLNGVLRFDDGHVAEIVGTGLFVGLAAFAFLLYFLQRSRAEYLLLGLFCLAYSLTAITKVFVETGALAESSPVLLLYRYAGCLSMIASLEFVTLFSQARWRPADRIIEGLFLLAPLVGIFDQFWFNLLLVLCLFLLLVYIGACFASAIRSGVAEIKLLLPFLALLVLIDTAFYASYLSPRLPAMPRLHLGTIGVGAEDLTGIIFLAGIITVVLYRFHRVSREEQHASAEFRAAQRLQQALIPEHLPPVAGFRIATAYLPAQEVGGDFFQVLPLPCDSGVLLAIGDVSGKGLEAAMTVAVIIGALRTLAEYTDSPAALMTSLNRRLLDRGAGFCTCAILRLDPFGDGVCCSAGHLAPYLDGAEVALEAGLPLGLIAEATYTESPIHFGRGEQLTLVTDGIVEARNPRTLEIFGFERTGTLSTGSAREIAERALAFGHGAAQSDDITVLTLTLA